MNYLLYDDDFNLVDFGIDPISTNAEIPADAAAMTTHAFDELANEIIVEKPGFVYIYISNEDERNITAYFDDFEVQHTYGNIAVATDQYPFGLAMEGRKLERKYWRYGYQGEYAEKDDETKWNAFQLRQFDSVIGRPLSIDPARQFYSPYVWVGNNPIRGTDPTGGLCPECPDPNSNSDVFQIGSIFSFSSDGEHGGASYMLTSLDKGQDGWVRMDGMLNEVTVSATSSYNGFGYLNWLSNVGSNLSQLDQDYNFTGRGGYLESSGRVIVGATPMSVYDGIMVLATDENMYGETADTGIDKGFAVLGIISPINPSSAVLRKPAFTLLNKTISRGKVVDKTLDVASGVHDSGALNSLKE